MKRILMIFSVAVLLVYLLPLSNIFADEEIEIEILSNDDVEDIYYPDDYVDGVLDDPDINFTTNFPANWYDNSLSSRSTIGKKNFYVEFDEPLPIYSVYINSTHESRGYKFTLKNGDEVLYESRSNNVTYEIVNLQDVIRFEIDRLGSFSYQIAEIELFTLDHLKQHPTPDIIDINYEVSVNEVTFNYELPNDENFSHLEILFENETYTTTSNSYQIQDLDEDTEYEVTFYVVDELGYKSQPIIINFKTDEVPPPPPVEETDIHDLNAEVSEDRVDLSWNNPKTDEFEKAIIYRQTLKEGSSLSFLKPMTVSAFSPIFETNGTTFSDLTVQQGTAYEYKVTAMINNIETEGATVRTSQIPVPPPIDMDEVELPFGAGALLQTVFEFVGILAPFILLVMAIYFAPRIINVIKNAAQQRMLKNDRLRR